MSLVPIVPLYAGSASQRMRERVESLAEELVRERPALALSGPFRELVAERIEDAPTLHVDDLGSIHFMEDHPLVFLQDRARLRAGDGDLVASCSEAVEGFEHYCEACLGLGAVEWLRPRPARDPMSPATACWTDRETRRSLVRAVRGGELVQIHPHMGCFEVWALASLLERASRRPLRVLAPPPALARCVNDKVWFSRMIARLFGEDLLPLTAHAANYAALAHVVQGLAPRCRSFVVKLPDSAGGIGNVVFEASRFRGMRLGDIRRRLRKGLRSFGWEGEQALLVSAWESRVLQSLSSQLWIPPAGEGPPVVEGLFEQALEGDAGKFVGCRPAELSSAVASEILERSWVIGLLFQRLGYVGRASFDLLAVGEDPADAHLRFIECNGRWGGTSTPMTLMNRLFGEHHGRAFAVKEVVVPGLWRLAFEDLLAGLEHHLYDARTGRGSLILFNPGSLRARRCVYALALGEEPLHVLDGELPELLRELVAGRCRGARRAAQAS